MKALIIGLLLSLNSVTAISAEKNELKRKPASGEFLCFDLQETGRKGELDSTLNEMCNIDKPFSVFKKTPQIVTFCCRTK